MADIFISYAREDRAHAERLAAVLQELGFSVWWDVEDLPSGQSFNRAIQQALESAKRVLVLWSDASIQSDYVEAEAYWAWKNKKLHSIQLSEAVHVPVPFNTSHARDLAAWDGTAGYPELRRLITDITRVIGSPTPAIPTEPSSPPERGGEPIGSQPPPLSSYRDPLGDGGEGPEMVVIPAGTFLMGSPDGEGDDYECPRHEAQIGRAFAIGKYPVTFEEYDAFATATDRDLPDDERWGRGRRPVINISWEDAVAYTQWLSTKTGKRYRLPSEAEWEYACRAGTETRWSFGDEAKDLDRYAWHWSNAGEETHPVGEKEPNPWGLHDMHGNVFEWVADCWHESYKEAPKDGSAWEHEIGGDCGRRVLRGGSWGDGPEDLRSAFRGRFDAFYRFINLGFRLAQDL